MRYSSPSRRADFRSPRSLGWRQEYGFGRLVVAPQPDIESKAKPVAGCDQGLPPFGRQAAQQGVFGEVTARMVGTGDQPVETRWGQNRHKDKRRGTGCRRLGGAMLMLKQPCSSVIARPSPVPGQPMYRSSEPLFAGAMPLA